MYVMHLLYALGIEDAEGIYFAFGCCCLSLCMRVGVSVCACVHVCATNFLRWQKAWNYWTSFDISYVYIVGRTFQIYRVYLSFYLKYGIYKPMGVKNPIKKRVHKHEFLYMIFHLPRFINPIF